MNTAIDGQLSALDLLGVPKSSRPTTVPTLPITQPATPQPSDTDNGNAHKWCEACGDWEFMSWDDAANTDRFGHPVCVGMGLTLNHISYSMGQGYLKPGEKPWPCCHDTHGIHGKKITKPTREHWLDHVRVDIDRAKAKWKLHLPSLVKAVGDLRDKHGIDKDEAPVFDDHEPEVSV